jgi:HSP20 family protein
MKYVVTRKPYNSGNSIREFDRIFNSFWNELPSVPKVRSPRVDIREREGEYLLEAELPGLTEKDVEVNVEKHILTISSIQPAVEERAEVKAEEKSEGKAEEKAEAKKEAFQEHFLVREIGRSSFHRSFKLPEGVSEEAIKAEFKNGILTLVIPKVPAQQPKKIEVKLAS